MTNKNTTETKRIRGLLLANYGITLTQIATRFDVSRQFVHQVIRGIHSSDKAIEIRKYISEKINQE